MVPKANRCIFTHASRFLPRFIICFFATLLLMANPFCFGQNSQNDKTLVQQKSKKQPALQASSPGSSASSISRSVIHTSAYKLRKDAGPHISLKITPPEKRGKKGMVLVEIYNYSKTYLAVMDFWLILNNNWGDRIEVHVTCDDVKPNWSALKWVKIEGNKPFPKISQVEIRNMVIFNEKAQKVDLKHYTDLIKS